MSSSRPWRKPTRTSWVPELTECLARNAHARGDHVREAACYEAQRIFHDRYPEPLKDTLSLRETLRKLARVYQKLGDPDRAEGHLQAALSLARKDEAPKAAARILLELSRLSREGGRYREAEGHAKDALELGAGLKDRKMMGNARVEMGENRGAPGGGGEATKASPSGDRGLQGGPSPPPDPVGIRPSGQTATPGPESSRPPPGCWRKPGCSWTGRGYPSASPPPSC